MITVRQIERLWKAKGYDRLFAAVVAARPEASLRLGADTACPALAAAMAIIRLDELSQSHAKLYSELLKTVLGAQETDGGWGDPIVSALCLRALLCGAGHGVAIDRGMAYLAALQKTQGTWPKVPIRRMPADPYVSALILYELGDQPRFRKAVRLADAIHWFTVNEPWIEPEARELWNRSRVRCRLRPLAAVPSLC